MDYRFQYNMMKIIKRHKIELGEFDYILVAGGAGNFDQLSKHLKLSIKFHNPQEIILFTHADCKAGAKRSDLDKAEEVCRKICKKNIPISSYHINLPNADLK